MAVYFLDASALVKRYVTEAGSGWVRTITNPAAGNSCWICTVSWVEVLGALYRRARMGTISAVHARQMDLQFRHDLASPFQSVEPIPTVVGDAMRLISAHPLRAYDAVQLAAALYLRSQNAAAGVPAPAFVVSDHDLIRAATAEGLTTDDPNLHP